MARASRLTEITYNPRAECLGDSADADAPSNCSRTWPASALTLDQVKQHVKQTGHRALVVRETRSLYGRS